MDAMGPMDRSRPQDRSIMIRAIQVGAAAVEAGAMEMEMTLVVEAVAECPFIRSLRKSRRYAFRIDRWVIIRRLARPCSLQLRLMT